MWNYFVARRETACDSSIFWVVSKWRRCPTAEDGRSLACRRAAAGAEAPTCVYNLGIRRGKSGAEKDQDAQSGRTTALSKCKETPRRQKKQKGPRRQRTWCWCRRSKMGGPDVAQAYVSAFPQHLRRDQLEAQPLPCRLRPSFDVHL